MDSLTDDALLIIFSFLTIQGKCKIARVCQRFHKLVQDSSLWRYIDVSQVEGNQSEKLVRFLQRYACQSTRFLRLGLVDNTVLLVIHQTCDNLKQLSLTTDPTTVNLSLLPNKLQWLRIICVGDNSAARTAESSRFGVQLERFAEDPLVLLQYLDVKGAIIDNVFCQKLIGSQTLRQLRLDHCSFQADIEFQKDLLGNAEMIELDDCRFVSSEAFYDTVEIVGQNPNLLGLGLTDPSFSQPVAVGSIALDNLFQAICSQGCLRYLSVNAPGFCTMKDITIVRLFKSLHQLEILSLEYNQSMSDRVLIVITEHSQRLMVLNLYGNRYITDAGIEEMLSHHPTLRALCIGACFNLCPVNTFQVAATIPNLILLGMSRPRQESSAELSQFEMQNPGVVIEHNYDTWVSGVRQITQLLSEYEMKDFI